MESNKQIEAIHLPPGEVMQANVDFDKQEPQVLLIAGFGIATIICLVTVVLGIQAYFEHVRARQVYEQVMVPVADDYKQLRTAEEDALNNYKYDQQDKTVVHIPIQRAMELLAKEAAAGKLQYAQKEYAVKVPGTDAAAPSKGSGSNNANGNGGAQAAQK
jgi:hypothetical protein